KARVVVEHRKVELIRPPILVRSRPAPLRTRGGDCGALGFTDALRVFFVGHGTLSSLERGIVAQALWSVQRLISVTMIEYLDQPMPTLPTLRQIAYLVELSERLNFRAAAEARFVTQSTLSAGIKELETLLGVQLVERDKHHVRLTAVGEDVAARGRE